MDTDAIVASALDIISDECTLKNDMGEVLQIRSSDDDIQKFFITYFTMYLTLSLISGLGFAKCVSTVIFS
jgi:hypothetical protein